MAEEKRKNEERIELAEQKLKRKQTELEALQQSISTLSQEVETKNKQIQEQEERLNQTIMQFKCVLNRWMRGRMDSLDVEHLKKQLEEEHQQHEILMEHQRISYSSLQSQYDELYKRYQSKQEELNKRDKEAVLARYERGDGEEMKRLKEQMEQ